MLIVIHVIDMILKKGSHLKTHQSKDYQTHYSQQQRLSVAFSNSLMYNNSTWRGWPFNLYMHHVGHSSIRDKIPTKGILGVLDIEWRGTKRLTNGLKRFG